LGGEACYVNATIMPILDKEGQICEFVSATHDITEIIKQKKLALHQMYTDELTELPNRLKLLNTLQSMPSMVIMFIDIEVTIAMIDWQGIDLKEEIRPEELLSYTDMALKKAKEEKKAISYLKI